MRLLWSSRSPFARKVVVAAHELGIADLIALERVVVSATTANPAVLAHNPLAQIPTLILDDGTALFDSRVILDYLDDTVAPGTLVPRDGPARWTTGRLHALADGLMTLNVLRLAEARRGESRSPEHDAAYVAKTRAALAALDAADLLPLSAAAIAAACALAHLDFRFPADPWRDTHPRLAAWFALWERRPSMLATAYVDTY